MAVSAVSFRDWLGGYLLHKQFTYTDDTWNPSRSPHFDLAKELQKKQSLRETHPWKAKERLQEDMATILIRNNGPADVNRALLDKHFQDATKFDEDDLRLTVRRLEQCLFCLDQYANCPTYKPFALIDEVFTSAIAPYTRYARHDATKYGQPAHFPPDLLPGYSFYLLLDLLLIPFLLFVNQHAIRAPLQRALTEAANDIDEATNPVTYNNNFSGQPIWVIVEHPVAFRNIATHVRSALDEAQSRVLLHRTGVLSHIQQTRFGLEPGRLPFYLTNLIQSHLLPAEASLARRIYSNQQRDLALTRDEIEARARMAQLDRVQREFQERVAAIRAADRAKAEAEEAAASPSPRRKTKKKQAEEED